MWSVKLLLLMLKNKPKLVDATPIFSIDFLPKSWTQVLLVQYFDCICYFRKMHIFFFLNNIIYCRYIYNFSLKIGIQSIITFILYITIKKKNVNHRLLSLAILCLFVYLLPINMSIDQQNYLTIYYSFEYYSSN